MNVLDILLLLAAVWFAVVGYRQGFVVGILSVTGFLGGGLVAVYLLPVALGPAHRTGRRLGTIGAVVAVAIVIVCASVGQAFTTHLGNKLRRYITWSPARALDATGGALVNVAGDAAGRLADRLGAGRHDAAHPGQGGPHLQGAARGLPGGCRPRPTAGSPTSPRCSRRTASRRSSAPSPTSRSPMSAARPGAGQQPRRGQRARQSIVKVVGTAPELRQGPGGLRLRLRRPTG